MSRLQEWKEFVEKVREAWTVEELIQLDVEIGSNGLAICPLHNDHDPSLHVWDNAWFCHGACQTGGDVFSYYQRKHDVDWKESVVELGKLKGLAWTTNGVEEDPEFAEEMSRLIETRRVRTILTSAAWFCARTTPTKARRWIEETWGFDREMQIAAGIGYVQSENLIYWLRDEEGYSDEDLLKTGLFIRSSGGIECFFDCRVMFPYFRQGLAVFAIGRRTPWTADEPFEQGKYKKLLTHSEDRHPYVSPCIQNEHLYGEDDARGAPNEIRFVTEGVADAALARAIGLKCISPVTTRFRQADYPKLEEIGRRIQRPLVICNDSDVLEDGTSPGLEGAKKTAEHLFRAGIDARILQIPRPDGETKIDLNDYLRRLLKEAREAGSEDPIKTAKRAFLAFADSALPYPNFQLQQVPTDLNPTEQHARLTNVFKLVATCPPVEREGYATIIARRFRISKSTVKRSIEEHVDEDERRDQQQAAQPASVISDDRIRGQIFEDLDHYYLRGRTSDEVISSFTLTPTQIIETEDGRVFNCEVRTTSGVRLRHQFPKQAFNSKRELLKSITHSAMTWTGNDDNTQALLGLINAVDLPVHQGTNALGLCETSDGLRWVTPDGSFGPDGPVDDQSVVYAGGASVIGGRLDYSFPSADETLELARKALPMLQEINDAKVVLPSIGWWFATTLKPLLFRSFGHFPIFMVHGTQGGGKTSIVRDAFWPLLGVYRGRDPFSCTDTMFSMIKNLSSTTSIPLVYDEFRNDLGRHRIDQIHRIARRVYNQEVELRGRSDQAMNQYPLSAPLCIVGETKPENDPALLERLIVINPDKTALTPERIKRFGELTSLPLQKLSGPLASFAMSLDVNELVEAGKSYTENLLGRIERDFVPIRCLDNLRVMMCGVVIFERFASELGVELPDMDYVGGFRAAVEEILEGEASVKDAFDHFIEQLHVLAHLGALRESKHYALKDGTLFLHLPSCHKVYLDERRKSGLEDASNGLRALKKIAREKHRAGGYVTDIDFAAAIGDSTMRCVAIDQDKVPASLDFERLPANGKREDEFTNYRSRYEPREDDDDEYGAN